MHDDSSLLVAEIRELRTAISSLTERIDQFQIDSSLKQELEREQWEKVTLQAILQHTQLDPALESIMYFAPKFCEAEAICIVLPREDGAGLELRACTHPMFRKPMPLNVTEDFLTAAFQQISPTTYEFDTVNLQSPICSLLRIRNMITLPLVGAEECIGTISWINKLPSGKFDETDAAQPKLRQFVTHAAVAIEHVLNIEVLRRQADLDQMTGLVRRDRFGEFAQRLINEGDQSGSTWRSLTWTSSRRSTIPMDTQSATSSSR